MTLDPVLLVFAGAGVVVWVLELQDFLALWRSSR